MSIANKIDFANYPTITVLSQQDLEEMYRERYAWYTKAPSPLSLLELYIEEEKPQHLIVDEVPFEKVPALKLLLLLGDSIYAVLTSSFGHSDMIGFLYPDICVVVCFLSCVSNMQFDDVLGLSMTITSFLIFSWFNSNLFIEPISLNEAGTILKRLVSPSSLSSPCLWLALHSSPLTDNAVSSITKRAFLREELVNWKSSLMPPFTVPTLKHNLRNSPEVARARGLDYGTSFFCSSSFKALPTAPCPRPLPTMPPTPVFLPIYLPLHSSSRLREALNHAFTCLESPNSVVVLLDDVGYSDEVIKSFIDKRISTVTYTKYGETKNCKNFLKNPAGVFITTPQLFSGMEAANIIWVRVSHKSLLQRSNTMRAIHKLCVIDTNNDKTMDFTGFKVDGIFAKCHKPWIGSLYWCKSCKSRPTLLCRHCALVCHPQSCRRECAVFRFYLHSILQYNPCSCETTGRCKLKKSTLSPTWCPRLIVIFAGVFALMWINGLILLLF